MLIHKTSCELCQRIVAADPNQPDTILVLDKTGQLAIEIQGTDDTVLDTMLDKKVDLVVYIKYLSAMSKEWIINRVKLNPLTGQPTALSLWEQLDGTNWSQTDTVFRFSRDNTNALEDFVQKFNIYHGLKYGQEVVTDGTCNKMMVGLYRETAQGKLEFWGPVREYWQNGKPKFVGWYTTGQASSGKFYDPYGILCVKIAMIDKGMILPAYNIRLTIGDHMSPTNSSIRSFETKAADMMSSCSILSHRNVFDRIDFAEIVMRAHGIDYKQIAGEIYNVIDPQLAVRILVEEFTKSEALISKMQKQLDMSDVKLSRFIYAVVCIMMLYAVSNVMILYSHVISRF